jgi:hypothetical protein
MFNRQWGGDVNKVFFPLQLWVKSMEHVQAFVSPPLLQCKVLFGPLPCLVLEGGANF